MLDSSQIATLAATFRGDLIQPTDARYDEARALYNAMIDKRPRLIACCADTADVMAAVNFGRDHGLRIAIRGGGHNGAGFASCDDGLTIDLSRLKGIRVDPVGRTVRAEAGCTQGDVDHATHASAGRCRQASSRQPASAASPSAVDMATSVALTG